MLDKKPIETKIEAHFTWGDGPDVLLCMENCLLLSAPDMTHGWTHGIAPKVHLDLTKDQAQKLIYELYSIVGRIEAIEQQCIDHDKYFEEIGDDIDGK